MWPFRWRWLPGPPDNEDQMAAPGFLSGWVRGLTIQAVTVVGFVSIFLLWVVSGYSLVRRMTEVEERASRMSADFTRSEELLFTLRTQVLLSAIYRRDALLDTEPDGAEYYREQLRATRRNIDRVLQEYAPVMTSANERQNWATLLREVEDYWQTLLPERVWDPSRKPAEARAFLRHSVIPKREVIIRISEGIQRLNRASFQEQQAELAAIHGDLRRRFLWTALFTFLLSLVVAGGVLLYAGRLELRIRQQNLEDRQNKRDLQRLSARLVSVQEEERRNIARELHDEIGQALTALKMDLALAERNLEPSAKARQPLEEARAIADRTLHAARDLSQVLHPAMLDDLGLPDALNWYLRLFSGRTGIRAEFVQDGMDGRLPADVELCVYRVVQEALTNVARHSGASRCRVNLARSRDRVVIRVEDDGKGFDPSALKAGDTRRGLGLVGIQERVAGLCGRFQLESAPNRGTRLAVELPAANAETAGKDSTETAPPVPREV